MAGAFLPGAEGLDEQRRRSRDEQPHVGSGGARQRGLAQHAHVERGHAHEDGGARQGGDHRGRVELGEPEHLARAQQRGVDGDEQAMHVEDGQRVDQHVALLPAPVVLQRDGVGQQVAVRQHGALAAPGGAAGVDDGGQGIGTAGRRGVRAGMVGGALEQAAALAVAQGVDGLGAGLEGDARDPGKRRRGAHHHGGLGVLQEVFDLAAAVGGVERQEHQAGAQRRQVQRQRFDGFFHLHGHARAGLQAVRVEQVGDAGAGLVELGPAVVARAAVGRDRLDGGGVQIGGKGRAQGGKKVVWAVHGGRGGGRAAGSEGGRALGQEGGDAFAVLGAVGVGVGAIYYIFHSCLGITSKRGRRF